MSVVPSMKVGIIGFQRSGKTTVFNALTGEMGGVAHSQVGGRATTSLAVVKVPDERVDRLADLMHPQKVVHASVEYHDLAGIEREDVEKKIGLGEEQLHALANMDALLAVIRAFDDGSGIAPDIPGDVEAIRLELLISDLQKVENRLPKVEKSLHKMAGKELEQARHEFAALNKVKGILEKDLPVRCAELFDEETKILRGFMLLTMKPLLFVLNVGEELLNDERDLLTKFLLPAPLEGERFAAMCGEIEAEICQLSSEERQIFLQDYHVSEQGAEKIIRLCYELLGYVSFFTMNPKELHVWTLTDGTTAVHAAGAVHSDMEHGFIRAEVVRWDNLLRAGGFSHARKTADVHIEGKDYKVQDGDVIQFLFNV